MASKRQPSYTDLVYEVLQAGQPLTVPQILERVSQRRPVTTRDPKRTIYSVLSQAKQLVSLGDGRYGYLPRLIEGSLLRLPLRQKKPANHPLVFPDEIRYALDPSFLDTGKRRLTRTPRVRLPDGQEVELPVGGVGGEWGSPMPEGLRGLLVAGRAAAGDALLLRVLDGEAGRYKAWFEPRRKRDEAAVAARNREIADAAGRLIPASERGYPIWDLVILLLGRGHYRADVAPDPLAEVLAADPRFTKAGMGIWMLSEYVTPEIEADIRARRRLFTALFGGEGEAEEDTDAPPRASGSMERTLSDLGAILADQESGSLDEANALLDRLLAEGGVPRREARTPVERAQELIYEAWESPNPRGRIRLARRALEICPDCADAYVLLAEETARTPKQAAELYAQGVAAGERALGPQRFAEAVGAFWGIVETRPYMQARFGLATTLWEQGRHKEATAHAWEMLRLNPSDNQGVRYVLLGWLLELGEDAQTGRLLGLYEDDIVASWPYGRALHAFRTEGDTERARALLAEAREANRFVPAYLLGRKRVPRRLPVKIGFGDESEAIECAVEQIAAWRAAPGALEWLARREAGAA